MTDRATKDQGLTHTITAGDAVVVPAGTEHNVCNTSSDRPLPVWQGGPADLWPG